MGENPVALRAAVFSLSSKNLRGAFKRPPPPPPPPAGRGLRYRDNAIFLSVSVYLFPLVFPVRETDL